MMHKSHIRSNFVILESVYFVSTKILIAIFTLQIRFG